MCAAQSKGRKKLSPQALIGDSGIAFIHGVVNAMGCAWHPTSQPVEVGIDGDIELFDPATHEGTNAIVRVQSRATIRRFTAETDTGFEYLCADRELEYWMSGNTPVILVVSRPHQGEGYWVSIKDYFADPRVKKTRKVLFNKQTMRFDKEALPALFQIAGDRSKGLYFAAPPRAERVYTNLLQVLRKPQRLWLADTGVRNRREVFDHLLPTGSDLPEFVVSNKRILSAHDLRDPVWRTLVDQGTVDDFPSSEWGDSSDLDKRHLFAELLIYCLGARARQIGVEWFRDGGDTQLWFASTSDLSRRTEPYESVKERGERTVFQGYPYKAGPRAGEIAYYRHFACDVRFRRYDWQWYLELNPTYRYTTDGKLKHPFSHEYLAGIKRQEKQGAVMYQMVLWASVLRGAPEGDDPFFATNTYSHLGFGPIQTFDLDVGIDDKAWLPNEDAATQAAGNQTLGDLPLFFEPPDPYLDETSSRDDED